MLGYRSLLLFFALTTLAASQALAPASQAVVERITADSLRGHVSFLASDTLEGRGTPSRGLDVAAEYIAAQFRRAGLEAAGDNGYFQTAPYVSVEASREGLSFAIDGVPLTPEQIAIETPAELTLDSVAAVKYGDGQEMTGKVVFLAATDFRQWFAARQKLAAAKPALVVVTGPMAARVRSRTALRAAGTPVTATIAIKDDALASKIDAAEPGALPFKVSVRIAPPVEQPLKLRNVVGLLRGSDPALKDTYVLVTAHYDHLGIRTTGQGDRIYNGANDDASGTASIIDIAAAIAPMNPRPRRSLVFIALFGEEMGLLGSRYYGAHPLFPLNKTVADVNLEHMGRTDTNEGNLPGIINFTGFDFSDVPQYFKRAGALTGVQALKDQKNSDPFFARSDNQALADVGIPAHTISIGYEFPGYHQADDHWEKLDYDNMAKVSRAVALGLVFLADSAEAPRWNESDPKTAKYVEAARKLHSAN